MAGANNARGGGWGEKREREKGQEVPFLLFTIPSPFSFPPPFSKTSRMEEVCMNAVAATVDAWSISNSLLQERIKGTEKASPIHTLFHR